MMKLNLNPINCRKKKFSINFFCTLLALYSMTPLSHAQSKVIFTGGFSIAPTVESAFNNGDAYTIYRDSVKSTQGARLTLGIHAWVNYSIKKNLDIQAGIGYLEAGFSRKQSGLIFHQSTYPGIGSGKILDATNTQRDITYNYRFQYIQLPVMLNTYVKRSGDFKWVFNFSAGLVANILLKHQIQANLNPGFTIEGQKSFKIDSTGFDARLFALNLIIGSKIEYKADKNKIYFIQPLLGYYPLSVSGGDIRSNPWYFTINVGIMYSLSNLRAGK
ncbi:MAG: outer membrane beta-barrel protein [Bacteroidota bacterium]|nr:outer membrane beta-barrel protein [Bacteroidota bacterium]